MARQRHKAPAAAKPPLSEDPATKPASSRGEKQSLRRAARRHRGAVRCRAVVWLAERPRFPRHALRQSHRFGLPALRAWCMLGSRRAAWSLSSGCARWRCSLCGGRAVGRRRAGKGPRTDRRGVQTHRTCSTRLGKPRQQTLAQTLYQQTYDLVLDINCPAARFALQRRAAVKPPAKR